MLMSLPAFVREVLILWLPATLSVFAVIAALRFFDWWLLGRHPELGSEKQLPRQLMMLALTRGIKDYPETV